MPQVTHSLVASVFRSSADQTSRLLFAGVSAGHAAWGCSRLGISRTERAWPVIRLDGRHFVLKAASCKSKCVHFTVSRSLEGDATEFRDPSVARWLTCDVQ